MMLLPIGYSGPLGAGKLSLAQRLTTILPDMTLAEALDTTGPCRAPHQPMADVDAIGGSQVPMPGEVSRAHHGVLFLDELPECRRHVLEVLRQPFEKSIL